MIPNQPAPMVFIATPCFGGSVTTGYMTSVINLLQSAETHGVSVNLNLLGRDSLISRARNTLAAHFMTVKEATHLMFIDADIAFDPESVYRMMAFDGDVVGGMYPAKALCWTPPDKVAMQEPPHTATLQYVGKFCEGSQLERRGPFATGIYAATGFMMIKRRVIERLIQAHPELAYSGDHVHTPDKTKRDYYALFECGIDPQTREYISEDFGFCQLWRNLGGKVWLDVETPLVHTGAHDFVGAPALRYGSSEPLIHQKAANS